MKKLEAGLISAFLCVFFTKNGTLEKQRVVLGKKMAVKVFVQLLLLCLSNWKVRFDVLNTKLSLT